MLGNLKNTRVILGLSGGVDVVPVLGQRKDERAANRSHWHHKPEKGEVGKQYYSADPSDTMDATGVCPVENPK